MTTRIEATGPRSNVNVGPTAARTTAQPTRPFQQILSASASTIVATAEQAATRLPGGPILAAALRPGVGTESASTNGSASPAGANNALPAGSNGAFPGTSAPNSVESVLSQNSDQNLYYLQLQERISQESRTFTALSNVLKARHETVKNAITNIR
jgi:hypothetical protein